MSLAIDEEGIFYQVVKGAGEYEIKMLRLSYYSSFFSVEHFSKYDEYRRVETKVDNYIGDVIILENNRVNNFGKIKFTWKDLSIFHLKEATESMENECEISRNTGYEDTKEWFQKTFLDSGWNIKEWVNIPFENMFKRISCSIEATIHKDQIRQWDG